MFLMELTDEESERLVSEAVQRSPIVGPRAMSATHKDQPFGPAFGPAIPANLCSHMSIGMMVQRRGTAHERLLSSSCHVYLEMGLAVTVTKETGIHPNCKVLRAGIL